MRINAKCETFLPPIASAFLIMTLNKFFLLHCIVLYCIETALYTFEFYIFLYIDVLSYCVLYECCLAFWRNERIIYYVLSNDYVLFSAKEALLTRTIVSVIAK